MIDLLLISNSTVHGHGYLDHAESEIRELLGPRSKVLFVPYALHDRDDYAHKASARFEAMGYGMHSIHRAGDPARAVRDADAVFIGGGNTFRLLKALYDADIITTLRDRVAHGMPYIGSSAGSNVACPTIRTTKDMPIVQPPDFAALGLVPFQISPHYLDPDPASTHMGETQEQRILQFHEEASTPVVGLREGAMLRVRDRTITLVGTAGARIFRVGQTPVETVPPASVEALVAGAA